MIIAAFANGIDLIEWRDGALVVVPESQREAVEAVLSQPVEVIRSVDRMGPGDVPEAIVEQIVRLEPGTPEHVVRALLSLPGGFLLDGDDAIPDDDA